MKNESFWSHYAISYDRFMKKDLAAYSQMFELIRPAVKGKPILELATGTGLISCLFGADKALFHCYTVFIKRFGVLF